MKKALSSVFAIVFAFAMLTVSTFSASAATASYANGVRYIQSDNTWSNYTYGSGNLKNTGCGVFALVNAVYALTGNDMGVTNVAQWAHDIGAYNPGNTAVGTYRDLLYPKVNAKYGNQYGINVTNSGCYANSWSSTLINHLNNGGVAIGHVPSHFIAIVGYSNGKFLVYDSYPTTARGTSRYGDWKTSSQLATGKLNLDWFCLISKVATNTSGSYFPKCGSNYTSIVNALKSIGVDSSYSYRSKIAAANGISNYSGTASQNTTMLNMLKAGTLRNPSAATVSYFPKCGSNYTSIVNALKSIGVDSSYSYRSKIAAANGISNYSGTASQNTSMLNKLKAGTLKRP